MTTIGNQSRPAYVYDSETDTWVPIGVGPHTHDEYIEKTVITAKGDIIVGTASDAVTKLGVGPEGSVLIVDPTSPTGLAWGEAGGSIGVSENPPEDPTEGNVWFNASEGTSYIYYDGFWVPLSPAVTGPRGEPGFIVSDSEPSDTGLLWLDSDEIGVESIPAGGTAGQILTKATSSNYDTRWSNLPSENVIINGGFDVWQRGTSFTNTGSFAYTVDRWRPGFNGTGATRILSRQNHTPGAAPVAGEERLYFLRFQQSVAGSGGTFNLLQTVLEDVQTFAGQTVTLSFYGRASSAITLPRIQWDQAFGVGGSAQVDNVVANNVNIGTSWQRYSFTFNVPSIAGRTIGSASNIGLSWFLPINSAFTFDIDGVQVESGPAATPFRRAANTLQGELAACQRYFYSFDKGSSLFAFVGTGFVVSSTQAKVIVPMPVTMRTSPAFSVTNSGNLQVNTANTRACTSFALDMATPQNAGIFANTTSGMTTGDGVILMGNNSTNWLLEFSAEL
jgi:hypothetical protein